MFASKSLKARYYEAEEDPRSPAVGGLLKQIAIYENHAHDNFEELDSHLEHIEGTWDGQLFCCC